MNKEFQNEITRIKKRVIDNAVFKKNELTWYTSSVNNYSKLERNTYLDLYNGTTGILFF